MYDGILLTRPRQNLQNIEQRSIKNNHIELLSCIKVSNIKNVCKNYCYNIQRYLGNEII